MILEMISRISPVSRTRRPKSRKTFESVPAEVQQLDRRLLLSAVDDSAALTGNQTTVEIDVLANDTGMMKMLVSTGTPTNTTNGGMVTITGGKVTYSIPSAMGSKTLGEYDAVKTAAIQAINAWRSTEDAQVAAHYAAINTSIDRFAGFLGSAVSSMNTLGGGVGGVGTAMGGHWGAAGKALGFLASAAASNIGASNATIINAAHQAAATALAQENAATAAKADELNASLTARIALGGNPKVYTNDSFSYVMNEFTMAPMPGMPGMMMMMPVPSSANVSVSISLTDYKAMVMNIQGWMSENQGQLNMHKYPGTPDLDRIYGDMLKSYASSRGWTIVWQGPNITFWPGWYCAMTDWPFILDGTDIADELNSIGYQP